MKAQGMCSVKIVQLNEKSMNVDTCGVKTGKSL